MKALLIIALGYGSLVFGDTSAAAEPSVESQTPCLALRAPASISMQDTGLDSTRSACGMDSLAIGARALAFIDTPNFYGTLSSSLFLEKRMLHSTGYEFGVGIRLADFRFAQSAVFTGTEVSSGPLTLSILKPSQGTWWGRPAVVSHALKLEVPLSNIRDENVVVAASPSVSASLQVVANLDVHASMAALLWSVLPKSGADSRLAVRSSFDLGYSPVSFGALVLGTDVQAGWHGLGVDQWQLRGGFRVATGTTGALELSAGLAIAGVESSTLVGWLGYRFSQAPPAKKKRSRLQEWAK